MIIYKVYLKNYDDQEEHLCDCYNSLAATVIVELFKGHSQFACFREEIVESEDKKRIKLTLKHIKNHCYDWDTFCNEFGLIPGMFSEGLATDEDTYDLSVEDAEKHGLLRI